VRFRTLNRKSGQPVVSRYVDAVTGKPVDQDDEVKGYPRGEDDYVMLEDDEIDAVALESTRTIDIETFVPAETVDWIWYDHRITSRPTTRSARRPSPSYAMRWKRPERSASPGSSSIAASAP
jgi:Ku protein